MAKLRLFPEPPPKPTTPEARHQEARVTLRGLVRLPNGRYQSVEADVPESALRASGAATEAASAVKAYRTAVSVALSSPPPKLAAPLK